MRASTNGGGAPACLAAQGGGFWSACPPALGAHGVAGGGGKGWVVRGWALSCPLSLYLRESVRRGACAAMAHRMEDTAHVCLRPARSWLCNCAKVHARPPFPHGLAACATQSFVTTITSTTIPMHCDDHNYQHLPHLPLVATTVLAASQRIILDTLPCGRGARGKLGKRGGGG